MTSKVVRMRTTERTVRGATTTVIIGHSPDLAMRVSVFDRLKREADQQRLQAEALARERDQLDSNYRDEIEPRMKALTAYLEGLAATLLEVKPSISVSMPIQGYGDVVVRPIWDYKIVHERRHRSFVISMTWTQRVDSERTPVVRADSVAKVRTLVNSFRNHHLSGIKEEKRSAQGELMVATFHARGHIKAQMQAQISTDDPVLRLMFENASWLGSSRRQVAWNQIDDSLFDRIARFVIREDDSLFTEEVPEELRQRLRKEPEGNAATPSSVPVTPAQARSPAVPPPAAPSDPTTATRPPHLPPPPVATAPARTEPDFGANPTYASGTIAPPSLMPQGETIEIDESKLGLLDDVIAVDESKRGISVAPHLMEGHVIEFDESKLGFSNMDDYSDHISAFTPMVALPTRLPPPLVVENRMAPPVASPSVAPIARPPTAAPPSPATPVPPSAQPTVALAEGLAPIARIDVTPAPGAPATAVPPLARIQPGAPMPSPAPATPLPPAEVATPANAAPQPVAAPPPAITATPSAAAGTPPPALVATVSQPPTVSRTVESAPPSDPQSAPPTAEVPATSIGELDSTPRAADAAEADEAKERVAALFRLRMRAKLARLRVDEDKG